MIPFITFTLAEISNLFTDWEFSSSDPLSELDQLDLTSNLMTVDLANDDIFAFSNDPEFLADDIGKCSSSSTFPSRQRRSDIECDSPYEGEGDWEDGLSYRQMAENANAVEKISDLDRQQCLYDLPYLICSSKDPGDTQWIPSLLSFACENSARSKQRVVSLLCRVRQPSERTWADDWFHRSG